MATEKDTEKVLEPEKETEKETGNGTEAKQEKEKKETPEEIGAQLRELCRGKLKLMQPMRVHGQEVKEIEYDFCGLTGMEMMDAMDSAGNAANMFTLTNKQAMALFAETAEKCAPMIQEGHTLIRLYDKRDIKEGLAAADSVAAVQVAKLFYRASNQVGAQNISKE